MAEKPVYIINGFLEAGKTQFIRTTMEDPEFVNRDKILLMVCEEGEEEYDPDALAGKGISVVYVEDLEELSLQYYSELDKTYKPDKIIIELNGIWKMEDFLDKGFPKDWLAVQMITIVNAVTFPNYLNNMRSMIMDHLKYSDTVIFNRCTKDTDRLMIRRAIKPLNRKAQIIYEAADGEELTEETADPLPFDINADPVVIEDDDFGLFYLDGLDNPGHYDGKTIRFRAQFYQDENMGRGLILPGRFAMQCCAEDIGFIGFLGRLPFRLKDAVADLKNKDWIMVEGNVKIEFRREYRGKGIVIYITSLEKADKAEEDIVYFT